MRMVWTYLTRRAIQKGTVPKKPVPWMGKLWVITPEGERLDQSWKSPRPITLSETVAIMHQLVDDAIAEVGNQAVDAGWEVSCR